MIIHFRELLMMFLNLLSQLKFFLILASNDIIRLFPYFKVKIIHNLNNGQLLSKNKFMFYS